MRAYRLGIDPWLCFGAAFYWASVALRYVGAAGGAGTSWGFDVVRYILMALAAALSLVVFRFLGMRKGRRILVGAALAVCVVLTLEHPIGFDLGAAKLPLESLAVGMSIVTWGIAFASLGKESAAKNVVASLLVADVVILVGGSLDSPLTDGTILYLLSALSLGILISGKVDLINVARVPSIKLARQLALVFPARLCFGFFLVGAELACFLVPASDSPWMICLVILGIVIAIAAFAMAVYMKWPNTVLASLVVVAATMIFIPAISGVGNGMECMAPVSVWLSWCAFSAVQSSELKDRLGVSEVIICVVDKLVFAVALVLATATASALSGFLTSGIAPVLALCCVSPAVLLSSLWVALMLDHRASEAAEVALAQAKQSQVTELLSALVKKYGLTQREAEVANLLYRGYTGGYIADELCMSSGTVKAHASHIYQKIGVHKHDEFIAVVSNLVP